MADTYISNTVHQPYTNDDDTLYGVLQKTSLEVRDIENGAWDSFANADSDDYDISQGSATAKTWSGDMPVEVDNGFYVYSVYKMEGDSPDIDTDSFHE